MFCPRCRTEYREGFTICADCKIPLVEQLPFEAPPEYPEEGGEFFDEQQEEMNFSILLYAPTDQELTIAKCRLIDAGIPFIVRGYDLNEDVRPGYPGDIANPAPGPARLEVPEEYLHEARELFRYEIDKPDSETAVKELEHTFLWDLLIYAACLALGIVVSHSLIPESWDEGPRLLTYLLAGSAGIVLGNIIRQIKSGASRSSGPIPDAVYRITIYKPIETKADRLPQPRSRHTRSIILFLVLLAACAAVFYHYGLSPEKVSVGSIDQFDPGKVRRVIGMYEKALERDPYNSEYLCIVGAGYDRLSRRDDALRYFDRAIKIAPENMDCLHGRGLVYSHLWQPGRATDDFTAIIDSGEKYKDIADVYYARGNAFSMSGYYAKAIDDYNKTLQHDPKHANAYHARGNAYFYFLGRCDKAMDDVKQAIDLTAEDPYFLNSMAWILAVCKDKTYRDGQKAIEYALKALSLAGKKDGNDISKFYSTAAAAYAEAGYFEKAAKDQQRAYDLYKPLDSQDKVKDELREVLTAYQKKLTYAKWVAMRSNPRIPK
ncbi:MAG: tetratricopeptide repeat protein [Syntrophorhabdaceae bacterium]